MPSLSVSKQSRNSSVRNLSKLHLKIRSFKTLHAVINLVGVFQDFQNKSSFSSRVNRSHFYNRIKSYHFSWCCASLDNVIALQKSEDSFFSLRYLKCLHHLPVKSDFETSLSFGENILERSMLHQDPPFSTVGCRETQVSVVMKNQFNECWKFESYWRFQKRKEILSASFDVHIEANW